MVYHTMQVQPPDPSTSYTRTYTIADIHDMLDSSCSETRVSDESSSSDSDSDYNLSNPEAEVGEGLDLSSGEHEEAPSSIGEIDTRYGFRMDVETYGGSLEHESSDFGSGTDDSNKYSDGDIHSSNEVSSGDNDSSEESDYTMPAPVGRKKIRNSETGKELKRGRGRGKGRGRGRGKGRGRARGHGGARGQGQARGQGRARGQGVGRKKKKLSTCKLSDTDSKVPKTHTFNPAREVGPHLPSNIDITSPIDIFKLYFDENIVQVIISATNEYAEKMKDVKKSMYRNFQEMTADNFFAVVGIFIHMGYRKIPRYRLMWSLTSLCFDPIISKVMSRNKFQSFLSFLHNIVSSDIEKELQSKGDKLCKVRVLNDHLQKRCLELYQPHREISVDERMVRSKARFSYRQYIRNKPTKWGFKLWCLCDSHNGYTCSFSVYRGKNGEIRSPNGLSYDVVQSLIKPFLLQGYSLYIDNFYTSPVLVLDLYKECIHVTGTLDCSRIGVPSEIKELKKYYSRKNVLRGDGAYIRDDVCVYAVWRDTKCVVVLSNEHAGHSETKVTRNIKDKRGATTKQDVPIPATVFSYNRYMGGVDRSDQLIKNYNVLRQTKKYWKTLFLHYIDIAVVNSYILYKHLHSDSRQRMSHYIFRETLVRQLCKIEVSICQTVAGRKSDPTIEHRSERMPTGKDCVYCRIQYGVRRRTSRMCSKCEAPLCLLARNCFKKFHQINFTEKRNQWLLSKRVSSPSSELPGRPMGTTVPKGRGRRKRKNW